MLKNYIFKNTIKVFGNKGLGKNIIGKRIKKYYLENCKTNKIVINGYKMILDKEDYMRLSLFQYEPIETDLIKKHVKKRDFTIDVGANIGYFTLLMAKNDAIIHSYEPEPDNFKILKKNVFINNFKNVFLHNQAVSNKNGKEKLFLSHTRGQHKIGSSRFAINTINIETTKIDFENINFAKIDVEGAELLVLKGMKNLPDKMIIEFNSENLNECGSNPKEFFDFVSKYSIKEISKKGLNEPDFDKILSDKMTTNLFLT